MNCPLRIENEQGNETELKKKNSCLMLSGKKLDEVPSNNRNKETSKI